MQYANHLTTGDFGARSCQLLSSSSLIVLVGSGGPHSFSMKKLRVVNTKRLKIICELSFAAPIDKVETHGRTMAVGCDGEIFVYDLASMKLTLTLKDLPRKVMLHTCSNCGTFICYSDDAKPGSLIIYDSNLKKIIREINAHKSRVLLAKFSPDAEQISTASEKVKARFK